ncbi:ANTAR domain-containing protein [Puerhibacterium puerhi]|uniref:ANTAR domain-containing protein n=1 Tax=Puerhibacterium puerhi TaxID=2692623 RepID=UPI0013572B3E|nr:ANTAR domain-containing protein [Puerhibacterium puerhi]
MALRESLQDYTDQAAHALGHGIDASVTVREHGIFLWAASSAPAAARCDRTEFAADDGPCVAAMTQRGIQVVPAVDQEFRWEEWRKQAMREGYVTAMAVPADVGPASHVSLNLYSRTPQDWSGDLAEIAATCARYIAVGVQLQLQFSNLEDAVAGVYRDMPDSVAVERAVGAIMASNHCSEPQARQRLREASEHHRVSERRIAEQILRSLATDGDGDILEAHQP